MLLKLENVSHVYMPGTPFEVVAMKNINLDIRSGELLAIIGETGSGKSTLVQHLNGLLKPTSGKVILDGREIGKDKAELAAVRRRVGLLFQFPEQQLFEETIYADVAFGPRNLALPEEEIKTRVAKALQLVGLDLAELGERSPFSLSGGQMRRVAMAGVLAMEPEVLILDEPTAGLDPQGKADLLQKVVSLHRQQGMTVILVSHSMDDVARVASRLVVMSDGEIRLTGTPAEVFTGKEELEEMGLSLPQMTLLMHRLHCLGKDVPTDVFTVDQAKEAVLAMLRGEKH
jgi:energy-coupling factor transport system ATP-binding protein